MQVQLYLSFDGNCEEAFNFYKSVFDSDFSHIERYGDLLEKNKIKNITDRKILHISLPIGDTELIGSDYSELYSPHPLEKGNAFAISITINSHDRATAIFNDLSKNGETLIFFKKNNFNCYYGMCKDRFGIQWMLSVHETR